MNGDLTDRSQASRCWGQRPEFLTNLFYAVCFGMLVGIPQAHAVDLSQFAPATFRDFELAYKMPPKGHTEYNTAVTPLAIVVTYTGRVRPILGTKARYIKEDAPKVFKAFQGANIFELYEQEMEVVEYGASYWIPVQRSLFPSLEKELRVGQDFTLFVRYLGSTVEQERVYLMIEFDARVYWTVPRLR